MWSVIKNHHKSYTNYFFLLLIGGLDKYLSEYLNKDVIKSIVSFSYGNGATLEILKYFGHKILGIVYCSVNI